MFRTVAANLTDLHAEPSFLAELLTQVFNGWRLEVLEAKEEWCFVQQSDGYRGWAYKAFLTLASAPAATHLVVAPSTLVHSEQERDEHPLTRLLGGTGVCVIETREQRARIQPSGELLPAGWVATRDLRSLTSLPLSPADARRQMIEHARTLTGVYYLWGGCSAWGIDCSGLTQLVHRLCGYTIPRDSDPQFRAGHEVKAPFEPGDLLFFHHESNPDKITHVGLCTGGWRMIHSSRARNGVYEDDLQQMDLRHRFAGARSFISRQ